MVKREFGYIRFSTGTVNALVQGGRTYNEQYWEYTKKFIRELESFQKNDMYNLELIFNKCT